MKCKKCGAFIDTKTNEGICIICGNVQRIQTNGDIIRSMSNEQLAEQLSNILISKFEWDIDPNYILEYLNSEVQNEKHD